MGHGRKRDHKTCLNMSFDTETDYKTCKHYSNDISSVHKVVYCDVMIKVQQFIHGFDTATIVTGE